MDLSLYEPCFDRLSDLGLKSWVTVLRKQISVRLADDAHGMLPEWKAALKKLPSAGNGWEGDSELRFHLPSGVDRDDFTDCLRVFHPWRKGPVDLGDVHIDTEWRSDWKWDRMASHLELRDRNVLDVGCGNGYFGWRCLAAGAKSVVGIDPFLLFVFQHFVLKHFAAAEPIDVLPLTDDELPEKARCFDVALSMGVLYHRFDPIQHLKKLRFSVRPQGTVVLETLIVEGDENHVLMPEGRYAMMRNVWFLPSVGQLKRWLARVGFVDIQLVDVTKTSFKEQRSTEWMTFDSLPDFLDPADHQRTVEGYPAPVRAMLVMKSP